MYVNIISLFIHVFEETFLKSLDVMIFTPKNKDTLPHNHNFITTPKKIKIDIINLGNTVHIPFFSNCLKNVHYSFFFLIQDLIKDSVSI